jgi:hypothetical protein
MVERGKMENPKAIEVTIPKHEGKDGICYSFPFNAPYVYVFKDVPEGKVRKIDLDKEVIVAALQGEVNVNVGEKEWDYLVMAKEEGSYTMRFQAESTLYLRYFSSNAIILVIGANDKEPE